MKNINLIKTLLASTLIASSGFSFAEMDHKNMDHSAMKHTEMENASKGKCKFRSKEKMNHDAMDHSSDMKSKKSQCKHKASKNMDHSNMTHTDMNHTSMDKSDSSKCMRRSAKKMKAKQSMRVKEAGNDAFGTIQEISNILQNDPNTDWSKVNLEALRLHLLDMEDMTSHVDVISQTPIENGLVSVVKATTARSEKALERIFKAHPTMLKIESGFEMAVDFNDGVYTLTTTTQNPNDVDKIRGLGYIGLMSYGNHHQPHHLSLAKGENPHAGHTGHGAHGNH